MNGNREERMGTVLGRLQGVKAQGEGYMAHCPCHDDRHQSLSVGYGREGVVLKCHAGCDSRGVISALGLRGADLFYEKRVEEKKPPRERRIAAVYDYPNGVQKLRYADKSFTWRRWDPDQRLWVWNRRGVPPQLYQRGKLEGVIYVVEGEKDADNFHRLTGEPVVSGEDGAGPGKWKEAYTQALAGQMVCVIPDNDAVGLAYAQEVAAALHGTAKLVRVLDLRTVWPEVPNHGDISDYIAHLGEDPQKVCDGVVEMLSAAQDWTPPEKVTETAQETPPTLEDLGLVRLSQVTYEPPKWLLEPYVQRGKLTLVQGDPGTGKTAFACALAAAVTTGSPILGMDIETPGDVLLLSVEDDPEDLLGRIQANGGDQSRVIAPGKTYAGDAYMGTQKLADMLAAVRPRLLVLDPLQNFLGPKVDMHRANETRPRLTQLMALCKQYDCACVIIAHLAKSAGEKSPVLGALGSVDIPATMRSILHLVRDPEDLDQCLMVQVKCSNAKRGATMAYAIGDRGGVRWTGFSDVTLADLSGTGLRRKPPEETTPYEEEPMVRVVRRVMADHPNGGFWSYDDFRAMGAEVLGYPPYGTARELRSLLHTELVGEIQRRDHILVKLGHRVNGIRGVRLGLQNLPVDSADEGQAEMTGTNGTSGTNGTERTEENRGES